MFLCTSPSEVYRVEVSIKPPPPLPSPPMCSYSEGQVQLWDPLLIKALKPTMRNVLDAVWIRRVRVLNLLPTSLNTLLYFYLKFLLVFLVSTIRYDGRGRCHMSMHVRLKRCNHVNHVTCMCTGEVCVCIHWESCDACEYERGIWHKGRNHVRVMWQHRGVTHTDPRPPCWLHVLYQCYKISSWRRWASDRYGWCPFAIAGTPSWSPALLSLRQPEGGTHLAGSQTPETHTHTNYKRVAVIKRTRYWYKVGVDGRGSVCLRSLWLQRSLWKEGPPHHWPCNDISLWAHYIVTIHNLWWNAWSWCVFYLEAPLSLIQRVYLNRMHHVPGSLHLGSWLGWGWWTWTWPPCTCHHERTGARTILHHMTITWQSHDNWKMITWESTHSKGRHQMATRTHQALDAEEAVHYLEIWK